MTYEDVDRLNLAFDDFNRCSRIKVKDVKMFKVLLSVNPKLNKWYQDWSFQYSQYKVMPESFRKAGVTPEQFSEIQKVLPMYNKITADASLKIEAAAKEFDRKREIIELERNSKLKDIESPHILILKVNVTVLPLEDQILIYSKSGDERQALELVKVEEYRTKLFKDLSEGKFVNPFLSTDYQDLIIIT